MRVMLYHVRDCKSEVANGETGNRKPEIGVVGICWLVMGDFL